MFLKGLCDTYQCEITREISYCRDGKRRPRSGYPTWQDLSVGEIVPSGNAVALEHMNCPVIALVEDIGVPSSVFDRGSAISNAKAYVWGNNPRVPLLDEIDLILKSTRNQCNETDEEGRSNLHFCLFK